MTHLSIIQTARAKNVFRSPLLSPRNTLTSIGRFTMTDSVVSIEAKGFSSESDQWDFAPKGPRDHKLPTSLSIVTWNIDFATPEAARRLTAALDYLRYHAFPEQKGGKPPHCLILLQEINIHAFNTLLAHPWVREWFRIVPASPEAGWPRGATYGTVTLVHAPLANAVCVHYEDSYMGRNALVTDIMVGGAAGHPAPPRILRVINTHLESLPMGTPMRVTQMGVIAGLLKEEALGGIACGDMNAIAPSDATLPEQNGLSDAWEYHRRDREEEGTTWGYQPVTIYPPGRLDKILYTESDAFDVKDVRRIAVGLKMADGEWVSDHCGLACHVGVRQEARL